MNITINKLVINIENKQNLEQMVKSIDDLLTEVAETKTLAAGVQATVAGLRQKVKDAIADVDGVSQADVAAMQAKVDEAFTELSASNDQLAAALAENTSTPTETGATDGGTTAPVDGGATAPTTGDTPEAGTTSPNPVEGGGVPTDTVPTPDAGTTPDTSGSPTAPSDASVPPGATII